jgi:hypothetical protein
MPALPLASILTVFTALVGVACAQESGSSVRRDGDTLYVAGQIDAATLKQFSQSLNPQIRTVVVHSGGGDSLAATAMGREIYRRNLRVVVDGACLSACAHFVFLPAKKRVVKDDSLVMFHNTSSSILRMIKGDVDPTASDFLLPRVRAEQDLFEEAGVNETLLLQPQLMIRTHCYAYFRDSEGTVVDVKVKADYQAWVPRIELLKELNIDVEGFWPASQEDFARGFNRVFAKNAPLRALWGGTKPMSQAEVAAGFARISDCTRSDSSSSGKIKPR